MYYINKKKPQKHCHAAGWLHSSVPHPWPVPVAAQAVAVETTHPHSGITVLIDFNHTNVKAVLPR